jgi:hypothetical protein
MQKKIEEWISKKTWKALLTTKKISMKVGADIYNIELLTKIHNGYMKFLNKAFNIITLFSISFSLIYLFPIIFHIAYDRMILITLVLILLQLRYSKIMIKKED